MERLDQQFGRKVINLMGIVWDCGQKAAGLDLLQVLVTGEVTH